MAAEVEKVVVDRGHVCPEGLRKNGNKPLLDLIALLRTEMVKHPELIKDFDLKITDQGLTRAAAA